MTGRPTKYKPEYCGQLIEHMSSGLSYESFAAVVGVNRDTIFHWETLHEEWKEAKAEAFSQSLLFWEKQGIEGLYAETIYGDNGKPISSKSINATIWVFNMKNRFKWRDKQPDEIDTVVNNNNSNTANVTSLSDEQLDAKVKALLMKAQKQADNGSEPAKS